MGLSDAGRAEAEVDSEATVGSGSDDRDPVEALADEFIARRRKGETPGLDEYVARCPERAEEIRELFPAIAAMERWKPRASTPRRAFGGGPIRERIGEYRLIREIGRGGMGIVYEAEQESLGRRVAIKVLPGGAWADDRPMQRFLREAKTAGGLRHGHIVPVFAVGLEDGLPYYVMPLIEGAGLDQVILELRERRIASLDSLEALDDDLPSIARTLLERSSPGRPASSGGKTTRSGSVEAELPPLPSLGKGPGFRHWRGVAEVGRQVAEALQHAHERGILHRDIKPSNLLLDSEGVAWVADFGLAKAMSHDDLSRTGDLVGTLRYMAPERFRGESDARSDVYSLGLTLYELMTLRPAHDVLDRAELIRKIAEAEPTRPGELDPSIPIDLETVVLKAIEPDPKRRYESAGGLAEDLARFVEGRPVLARRATVAERLNRWVGRNRALAALVLLTIALTVFGGYFFRLWLMAPPRPPWNFSPPPNGRPRPGGPPPPRFDHPPPPRWR
jgi:serine/threonine protein kinase